MGKPRIVVLSPDNDAIFRWMSDGWATDRDWYMNPEKTRQLWKKAVEAITAGTDAEDTIVKLEEAGFEVRKATGAEELLALSGLIDMEGSMTWEEARKLRIGDVVYHRTFRNADKTPQRWRINGKMQGSEKTGSARIPVKHGWRDYDYLTKANVHMVERTEEAAYNNYQPLGRLVKWEP